MKKETYLKQITFLSDDIKWWMNVLLGLLSGALERFEKDKKC